jgi:hypothetical protein
VLVPGDDARGGEPSGRTKDGLQCGARFVETTQSLSNEVARHAATQIERELTQWGPAGGRRGSSRFAREGKKKQTLSRTKHSVNPTHRGRGRDGFATYQEEKTDPRPDVAPQHETLERRGGGGGGGGARIRRRGGRRRRRIRVVVDGGGPAAGAVLAWL